MMTGTKKKKKKKWHRKNLAEFHNAQPAPLLLLLLPPYLAIQARCRISQPSVSHASITAQADRAKPRYLRETAGRPAERTATDPHIHRPPSTVPILT